jgi:ribosome-associated protein
MDKNKQSHSTPKLIESIIEGVSKKKGINILKLDLTQLENTECDYFIICHGNSNTHVEAIAHSVEETVLESTNQKAWHSDGYRNAQWILLDYCDVMVHVFQAEWRNHYDIESLWADAKSTSIESK